MASNATSTATSAATTSITATVAQVAEHVVVEEIKAVATQVQKNNSADLKNIASNVSKEVTGPKAADGQTLVEKLEEGTKEVAKDVVNGVEVAGKEIEAHPELIAEGAVVAAAGVATIIAPELAIPGIAVISKMASDNAKKTLDGIAKDSSSQVVKAISTDLAKNVGDIKKPVDPAATTSSAPASADPKVLVKADGAAATTATAATVPVGKVDAAAPEVATSVAKPVTANLTKDVASPAKDGTLIQSTAVSSTTAANGQSVIAATSVAVAVPSTTSTATITGTNAIAPAPPVTNVQNVTAAPVASPIAPTPAVTKPQEANTTPVTSSATTIPPVTKTEEAKVAPVAATVTTPPLTTTPQAVTTTPITAPASAPAPTITSAKDIASATTVASAIVSTSPVINTKEIPTAPATVTATSTTKESPTAVPETSGQLSTAVENLANDSLAQLHQKIDAIHSTLQGKDLSELYQRMDAMHATFQNIATLLAAMQLPQQLQQQQAVSAPELQSSISPVIVAPLAGVAPESSVSSLPPLSLITPPLPPTTVETRSEMAHQNGDENGAAATSDATAATKDPQASKRSGIFVGLGKLFYLRS